MSRVLPFILFFFSSCATLNSEELYQQSTAFLKFVRWGRFKDASLFLDEKVRDNFIKHYSELEVVFTDAEIEDIKVNKDKKEGTVRVGVSYYRTPSMVLKEKELNLKWRWRNKRWVLEEGWELN